MNKNTQTERKDFNTVSTWELIWISTFNKHAAVELAKRTTKAQAQARFGW